MTRRCILWLTISLLISGCEKDTSKEEAGEPVTLSFLAEVNGQALDTAMTYTNQIGESYRVSSWKYYVSDIEFFTAGNSSTRPEKESYYLVDMLDTATQKIYLRLPGVRFDSVRFTLGVDSIRNVSGAQTGELDPSKGMFWTWNTGYIFAKLEGRSPVSSAPFGQFIYHIGGFRTGQNALRRISLAAAFIPGQTREIRISADLRFWFDGPYTLRISQQPAVMTPGENAMRIADNYSRMFRIKQLLNP